MNIGSTKDFKNTIYEICNKLIDNNKLVTTKSVLNIIKSDLNVCNIKTFFKASNLESHRQVYKNNNEITEIKYDNDHFVNFNEDQITNMINSWRLSRITNNTIDSVVNQKTLLEQQNNLTIFPKNDFQYKRKLIQAKKEIRLLKAKVKALSSFYNKQRQAFIMQIEGMLYK